MDFRKAIYTDIENIMEIITQAQDYLKSKGIDQWQNNYPNMETIKNDICNKDGYIVLENENIVGYVVVSFNKEKSYEKVYGGQWISNNEYAVIHRLAVHKNYRGKDVSTIIIESVEKLCLVKNIKSIKVDTHEYNKSMQKLLKKNSFIYCGVIFLEDGNKRIAFEKLI